MAYVNPIILRTPTRATAGGDALNMMAEETIGPKTNSRTVRMLHPDMHQTDPDHGRVELANRPNLKSFWLPDKQLNNMVMNANTPTISAIITGTNPLADALQGENGQYVKNQYAKRVNFAVHEADPVIPPDRQLLDIAEIYLT